jgi:transglutaminase-like putative cysteine protease
MKMLRAHLALIACLGFATNALAQTPKYKIQISDYQTVTATMSYEIQTTEFAADRWLVFLPDPPELPSQSLMKVVSDPVGTVVTENSSLARNVRFIDLKVDEPRAGSKLPVKLEIQTTLRTRTLVSLKVGEKLTKVEELTDTEQKHYTSPSRYIDFEEKPFCDWLDAKKLHPKKGESPLDFAARILELLRADIEYKFDPLDEKRASVMCGKKAGDCGGMTYLFVAAMRANQIPARALVGRLARPRQEGSLPADAGYEQPHIRAEIYLNAIGWVPVDPANANVKKNRPVKAFIGYDPGDLLVLHVDVDLKLPFPDPPGEKIFVGLQLEPAYWTFGKGTFDAKFGPTGWDLKTKLIEKKK